MESYETEIEKYKCYTERPSELKRTKEQNLDSLMRVFNLFMKDKIKSVLDILPNSIEKNGVSFSVDAINDVFYATIFKRKNVQYKIDDFYKTTRKFKKSDLIKVV